VVSETGNSANRSLSLFEEEYAVCRLDKSAPIPAWAIRGEFFSVSRTPDELSIVCEQEAVPPETDHDGGWRCFKIESPFEFDLAAMISSVAAPLADEQIDIFVVATQDSDYLLVRQADLDRSISRLQNSGYRVEAYR
jgi:hypothetical protein